jgi:hypothetical protein
MQRQKGLLENRMSRRGATQAIIKAMNNAIPFCLWYDVFWFPDEMVRDTMQRGLRAWLLRPS